MSVHADTYHAILAAMRGHRVDQRQTVATEIADELVAAGIIPSENDELLAVLNTHGRTPPR